MNYELCVDLAVLYFPTLKYFSKNSYMNYDNSLNVNAMTWYMDTRDKIDMETATPAIAYDTTTAQYFVMKAPKKKFDIIGNFGERLRLALPIVVFCGVSLFGCIMALCLYLAQAVEDAERDALLLPRDREGELLLLNTSQQTIPLNYGMEAKKAKNYKEALMQYKDDVDLEEIYE